MWFLKSCKGEKYHLFAGKYSVGRRNCDLVLDNDQSISRTHAVIEVSHPQSNWGNPAEVPVVEVSDAGSKYGTTLHSGSNAVKMEKDVKLTLKDGDLIHFGLQWNKWRLSYEPLVVVISALPKAEKHKVRTLIGELGGHVVADWLPLATHLTMASVTMTIKAISALARGKPIVTPQYWLSYKTAIQKKADLPKCEDYVPPIGETVLNNHEVSFLANPKRMSLFQGKTFYFFSEPQFKDHSRLVEAAGGAVKLVKNLKQKRQFVQPDAIPMQLLSLNSQSLSMSQVPELFGEVCEYLKSHGKRLIPASEIGLAVLHCSVEKYCNPDFNFSSMLLRSSEDSQPAAPGKILATETQDFSGLNQLIIGERKVIPDSGSESKVGLSLSVNSSVTSKAKSTQEPLQESLQVTQAATQLSMSSSQSQCQGPSSTSISARNNKRLRVIEDSDDEMEIISPRKVRPAGGRQKPIVISLDDSSNEAVSVVTSTASNAKMSTSRLDISMTSTYDDDNDDPDELFADFKESHPKTNKSFALQRPSCPDEDPNDLFADFQDLKPSTTTELKKTTNCHTMSQSPRRSMIPTSPACKRSLSTDDENEPPEKRFAKLDLSKQCDNANKKNQEDIQYMSTTPMKKEDESVNERTLYNTTIMFKPLVILKSNNASVGISHNSSDCNGIVNYKKFKKVNPLTVSVLPRIIGGSDLQPYQSFVGNNSVQNVINNESDSEDDGPDSLWGSVTQGKIGWRNNRSRKL